MVETDIINVKVTPQAPINVETQTKSVNVQVGNDAALGAVTQGVINLHKKVDDLSNKVSDKQDKEDSALQTTSKSIVGAINELKGSIGSQTADGYIYDPDKNSFVAGKKSVATGINSFATGQNTLASGKQSHAIGTETQATANHSHAEGYRSVASAVYAHAEGNETKASATSSHTEGYHCYVGGDYLENTLEAGTSTAFGAYAHAEGNATIAYGVGSHAEGKTTFASASNAHAEGYDTTASGNQSHAEGYDTTASGVSSHAEGGGTIASGTESHAEGELTIAKGQASHAEGLQNEAPNTAQHVCGRYSITDTTGKAIFQVGVGGSSSNRQDGFVVYTDGTFKFGDSSGKSVTLSLSELGAIEGIGVITDAEIEALFV